MEGLTEYFQLLKARKCQAKGQVDALVILERAFAEETVRLNRYDQAHILDALRTKVVQQVEYIKQSELTALSGFTKGTLIGGFAKFAIGGLIGAMLRDDEDPLSIGAKLAAEEFARDAPFGNVVVAVGCGGVPDDVNVIPLSRRARESGKSESKVIEDIKTEGYSVMDLDVFFKALDEIKDQVLKGEFILPVTMDKFQLKLNGYAFT
jgi:hypothetical protein